MSCFKRLNLAEIPLSHGLHPDRLEKTLTDRFSSELDRLHARILSSPIIQRTLIKMKEAKGLEFTEKLLQRNEKKIKQTVAKRIDEEVKEKIQQKETSDKKAKKEKSSKKDKEPKTIKGAIVKNPKPKKEESSDESDNGAPIAEDPFFLSTTGSNYLTTISTAVSESSDEDDDDRPPPKKQMRESKPDKYPRFNKPKPNFEFKRHEKKQMSKSEVYEKPSLRVTIQEKPQDKKDEDIHPSWAAKQQQKKLQIQEFQGTKIKFD